MIRLVPVVCLLLAASAGTIHAQPAPFYSPTVDMELPAGSVTLRLQRETPVSLLKGAPLGARWTLVLSGFGDPIGLDGRAGQTMAASTGFTDVTDARKRLTSRTDRRGNSVSITYDAQGRVSRIAGPKNTSLAFTVDRGGRVTAVRGTRGDVAYVYATENLTEVRVNGALTRRYTYGAAIGPSRVEDPVTGAIDVSYDNAGRISAYRLADGATMRFEFNPTTNQQRTIERDGGVTTLRKGTMTEYVDANNQRWLIEWDAVRNTRVDTAPDGSITRTTYDGNNRVVATVEPGGARTEYQYDAGGRVSAIAHPGDRRQTFEYDTFGSLLAERMNGQLVRSFTYNQDGTVASARGLNWPERRYAYSADGLLMSITMAMGGTTRFEYDARGNLIRETNPLGGATQHTYDTQNRRLSSSDPAGLEWKYRYDESGRLSEITEPGVGARRFEYDTRGRVVASVDAEGRTTIEYDPADRLTMIVRPGNQVETLAYDALGQVTRHSAADATTRTLEYDALGRMVRERIDGTGDVNYRYDAAGVIGSTRNGAPRVFERDPAGLIARSVSGSAASSFQYDPIGRLLSAADPLGHVRHLAYAVDGALASSSIGGGDEVQFSYDLEGRRTTTRRAGGGVDRVAYDLMGNVTATALAGSGEYRLTYDTSGRPTAITTPTGTIIKQSWDAGDRLVERDLGNGARQTFRRDAAGRVVEAIDGQHAVRYTYDAAGRVTSAEFPSAQKTVRSVYDDRGRRTVLTDGDGRQTKYEFNDAAQVTAIVLSDGSRIRMTFDAAGRTRTVSYPNGVVGTFEYDAWGQITRVGYVNARGQSLVTQEYRYDAAGNVAERRDAAGRVTRFAYDSADQLIEEVSGTATTRLQYAPGGNRRSMDRDGITTTYAYDSGDRLLSAETVTPPPANRRGAQSTRVRTAFEYDAAGALKSRAVGTATSSFAFDALERLTSVLAANGATTAFEYSADGDRLVRRDGANITRFVYDGLDLIQEIDGKGQTTAAYVFAPGIDRPLAMLRNGQQYFFLADRDGSIVAITDRDGAIVSSYEYDAFGNIRAQKEGVTSAFGFAGRELDRSTQLYFQRARYYDPSIGRFLSVDAAQPDDLDVLSFNPYIYASNNPLRYTDPLGLSSSPTAPYPSDVQEFTRAKLNELGTPYEEPVVKRPRPANPNPNIERVLAPAAARGRTPTKTPNAYPIRAGKPWVQNPRLQVLRPGGPEQFRVGPELAPKLQTYYPPDAVTPGRGTPAPMAPPPAAPFAKAPAMAAARSAPGGAPSGEYWTQQLIREAGDNLKPNPGPGVRDPEFRSPRPGAAGPPAPTGTGGSSGAPTGGAPASAGSGRGAGSLPGSSPASQGAAPSTGAAPATAAGANSAPPAEPRGAGGARPAAPNRPGAPTQPQADAPANGTLTLVLTVLQLAQCYKDELTLDQCGLRFLSNAAIGATVTTVVYVAERAGGSVLGIGRILTRTSLVLAGAQVGYDVAQGYIDLMRAAAATDRAERATTGEIDALRLELQRLGAMREKVRARITEFNREVGRAAVDVERVEPMLSSIEARVQQLEASAPACAWVNEGQETLNGLFRIGTARVEQLRTQVGSMRQLLITCATREDAAAIQRAGTQAVNLAGAVDEALQRAQEARDSLRRLAAAPASQNVAVTAPVRDAIADARTLLGGVSVVKADTFQREVDSLMREYRTAHAVLVEKVQDAKKRYADIGAVDEVIRGIIGSVVNIPDRFRRLDDDLLQESRLTESLVNERDAELKSQRFAAAGTKARSLDERLGGLERRLSSSTCSYSDDGETINALRMLAFDARTMALEAEQIAIKSNACAVTTPVPLTPTVNRDPVRTQQPPVTRDTPPVIDPRTGQVVPDPRGGFVPAVRNFRARLDCGDVLEIRAGTTELCSVQVFDWDSNTRTPVEVLLRPPLSPASGLLSSPGDTSMGGDVMHAAGVQDQPNRYTFSYSWSARATAPLGSTTVTLFIRQGSNVVRLPLTLNVIGSRAPTGSSLVPPTPVVTGSGGPYCVWQYKLFGDPPPCWHLVAASCSEPRYANRSEYVLVGSNLRRSEADKRVGDLSRYFNDNACTASTTTEYPPFDNDPGVVASTPANLQAELLCDGRLELVAGGRPESCGVRVRGWRSTTSAPVQVRIEPPISPASGIRISPGNTAQSGDTMYAAGVSDRSGEYVFSEFWSVERGAPASSNTMVVVVSQGNARVRLPITVNVVPPGTPTGSTFEPPTPNVTGSGGPYCVWRYKLFGDPVGCWHLVAAGCTAPRYAGRPEYEMVGNNMTRGEADMRIGQLSRYFDDTACKAGPNPTNNDRDPWDGTDRTTDPPLPPDPPAPPRDPDPPVGPVSRYSRFGIAPRDQTIKVGEAIELRAFATAIGASDMVLVLKEPEVRWSGDKPPSFTASAADAGRSFRITVTGPAGETDSVTISVERPTTTDEPPPPPAGGRDVTPPAGGVGSDGFVPPPAQVPATALRLLKSDLRQSENDRFGVITANNASFYRKNLGDGNTSQEIRCSFSGLPSVLMPGEEITITGTASASAPPSWPTHAQGSVAVRGDIGFKGQGLDSYMSTNPEVTRPKTGAKFVLQVAANPQSAIITLQCYPGGGFATHHYGK